MRLTLRTWEIASAIFFVYAGAVSCWLSGLEPARRRRAGAMSAAGILLTAASAMTPSGGILRVWLFPPLLLLAGYWTSGQLFIAPMPRVEYALRSIDRALRIRSVSAVVPRLVADVLELAYAGIYLLVPIALVLRLTFSDVPDIDRFWTVILVTDFVCFAALPWIQTRPPRALESGEPWRSGVRAFNLRLLGAASIQVNTFPSGHAAEALAAALLVSGAPAPVVVWMYVGAAAVSAAAVLGRYHYAADVAGGWLVAAAAWVLLQPA
jgi:membrane-associated phospholipid phosphatase